MNDRTPTTMQDAADTERISGTRPFVDYSSQMKITAIPTLRLTYRILGVFSLGFGMLGYMLPGLPGTVFILIAAYFFAQSSPRFYNWLMNHRVFGTWIRDFRAGKGIPLWLKVYAPAVILLSCALSIVLFFAPRGLWLLAMLVAAVGAYGVYYILRLPTRRRS
ncbi:MAG TPA: YbaN family protein [Trueperaceae bacterium]|nr:YbaN family protein [Trueperaceae bacterium]